MPDPCVFCDIASGSTDTPILHATDNLVVFRDIRPVAPVHLLIVPRRHIRSVNELTPADGPVLAEMFMAAREMAAREGVARSGYRLFINVERGGGQVIFHLHLHLVAGFKR
jgi:histidine triad (HIT) family protein